MKKTRHFSGSTFPAAGFVSALPDNVRRRLLDHGCVRKFAKDELIQQRGDTDKEFWYIQSGTVKIGRYSVDGQFTLFAVIGPGESFGEQAFLGEFPRMVDAITASETTLIQIGETELQAAIESDPSVARILLKAMAHMVRQAFDLLEAGRSLSTVERLALALVRLCREGDDDIVVPVTQYELADLVGVSRVSIGKALGMLEKSGYIKRKYGKITVCDQERLRQIAYS